ncbi:protein TIC 100 [Phalaenopsis equestris]|uniref:protein TIC 100 n=1 Tax=Phalaenopsis equestris TaxID=78828 RepID=UPI0009E37071|nr:protein TIC 100 [Phalaenopsis equestris]
MSDDREEGRKAMDDKDAEEEKDAEDEASSSSSSSESEYDSEYDDEGEYDDEYSSSDEKDNSPENNFRRFSEALDNSTNKKLEEEEENSYREPEELFNFPRDPENWREEDLRELWADAPRGIAKTGWDPVWAEEDDWEAINQASKEGRNPVIAPFYVPYRKPFPVIPDNHHDISNPKSVIEELDRIEEFLKWASFVFADGSTYEGTVWDDCAHGKGVYVAEQGLVRYEGEWLRNEMEGHGVVEVDIPDVQPVPGSILEAKMREEGRIITRDFMTPEDRRWLEMDIEDTLHLVGGNREIPFYENDEWVKVFGEKPEKGRYRYAGQWKHSRMHGCGVFEVNERIIYGRFYFGKHLEDSSGCDSDVSALHAGIAEVAAAKARMFVNKPDGMVREERGPYGDPQHPYFYEEDDVWMAPGFINQFYEVPDYWKTYVEEVDQEREMWLNSFYKAPLRIPMPAELEYWWSKDPDNPEFILINDEPEPDPENPSRLVYKDAPLILHTPTGRLINYVEDEEHGLRLFWQPDLEEGEDIDLNKVDFLPLGFDEFYGRSPSGEKKQTGLAKLITSAENALKPVFERLDAWIEEKKKTSEMKQKLIEKELEYIEAEICLEEAMEDLEMDLKMKQEEEERKAAEGNEKGESPEAGQDEGGYGDGENEEEAAPTSFGSVSDRQIDGEEKSERSSFSSLTMSFGSLRWPSVLPAKLQESLAVWKKPRHLVSPHPSYPRNFCNSQSQNESLSHNSVKMPINSRPKLILRAVHEGRRVYSTSKRHCRPISSARLLSSRKSSSGSKTNSVHSKIAGFGNDINILSLHVPLPDATIIH